MNGLYLTIEDLNSDTSIGVYKKIAGQVGAMMKLDINTWYSYRIGLSDYVFDCGGEKTGYKLRGDHQIGWKKAIYRVIRDFIISNRIDIVYIRSVCTDPGFLKLLKNMRKHVQYIYYEIPTYPLLGENRSQYMLYYKSHEFINLGKSIILNNMDRFCSAFLKRYIDYIVTYTDYSRIYRVPVIRIENGIDMSKIPLRKKNKAKDPIVLIGVANVEQWHGFDRLIIGLKDYYRDKTAAEVQFWIVGNGASIPYLKSLTLESNLQEHIKFWGCKSGSELDKLFDRSDIGISTLGYHRIGLHAGSALKTREYCARGIPFVYSYAEPMMDENSAFSLRVSSDDSPVDIRKVVDFYERSLSDPQMPMNMREFAQQNYDWSVQMKKVFERIRQVK